MNASNVAVNYVILQGAGITACPSCIKKLLLTMFVANTQDKEPLRKLAEDKTIAFVGDKQQYVKVINSS